MRYKLLLLCICLAAPACASPPSPSRPPEPLAAAQARGQSYARSVCAQCHSVEPTGESPDRRAPPFRTMSGDFVPLTLQRRLAEISETGHFAMAPISVHADDVADIVAYINSLERP